MITFVIFIGCSRSKNLDLTSDMKEKTNNDDWHNEILEKWNDYNLYEYDDKNNIFTKVEYKIFFTDESINIYDFNDGKTIIDVIEKKSNYLGFAVTRFKIEPTDKNWTWFLVVKYKKDEGLWDGMIKISLAEFNDHIQNNMLSLNCQYHELSQSIAVINNMKNVMPMIYFIDSSEERIIIMNNKQFEGLMPDEVFTNFYISFSFFEKIDNKNFKFRIVSDEILFGDFIWNIETNEIDSNLVRPINQITGKEL
jgi:hypothetical protein